jgi:PadR family transcriptional regulator, regulatory protein AphA
MSLRHALLGLLDAEPMTGYSLAKHFDHSAAYVWHAPHSQIYPELRRMEADGLISGTLENRGDAGTKRTYSLTDAGREELRRWVTEPTAFGPVRDAAYLKTTYFEYGDFESARSHFQAHMLHHEQQRQRWEAHVRELESGATPLLKIRFTRWPPEMHPAVIAYKAHVYRGLAQRALDEVTWARAGLALVDELEAAQAVTENA